MSDKKILIVYYSLKGHTRAIANNIKEITGGTVFEIELEKPYSLTTAATVGLLQAKNGHSPALKNHVTNIDEYNVIFIGSPIWWYTVTPPIMSFLKEYNLQNKTVVPFCTHDGDPGDFFNKFKNNCTDSKVIQGRDFYNASSKDHNTLKSDMKKWILEVIHD